MAIGLVGFLECSAPVGLVAGFLPRCDRGLRLARVAPMPRKDLRMGFGERGKLFRDRARNAPMQFAPPGFEQRFVCGILDQRCLN